MNFELSEAGSIIIIKPGTVVNDRYIIEREIGRGGMGVVYKAKDKISEDVVALKFPPRELAEDKKFEKCILREAKILLKLANPYIVRLHTVDKFDGVLFLVEEFVNGFPLDEYIAEQGTISKNDARLFIEKSVPGLKFIHDNNVFHKDIKPGNIMLAFNEELIPELREKLLKTPLTKLPDFSVKLMDFGIADAALSRLSQLTGKMTSGTLMYMSPEHVAGDDVDARSDIYSFGCVLYEMLAGEPPFSRGDVTHQILHKIPKPINCDDKLLNGIILKALEKDADNRFQSPDDFSKTLESGKISFAKKDKTTKLSKKSFPVIKVLTVLAVLLIAFAGYILNNQYEHENTCNFIPTRNNQSKSSKPKSPLERGARQGEVCSQVQAIDHRAASINLQIDAKYALADIQNLKNFDKKIKKLELDNEKAVNALKNQAYQQAYELFSSITNQCKKIRITHDYNSIKQKFDAAWAKSDKNLLTKYSKQKIISIEKNDAIAKRDINPSNIKLYQKSYNILTDAVDFAINQEQKIKYDALMTKADDCYQQKMWTDAKVFAEQAKKSGYKDVAAATALLIKIKKLFQPVKGKNFSLPISSNVNLEFVWIKPGTFKMGSNENSDEKPVHPVKITDGFWMGKYEVTQKQYQEVMGKNPSHFKKSGENAPVEKVSWNDCKEFCKKLSKKTGLKIRLPSEAEWEYACRADTTTKYCNGNDESDLKNVGWYEGNSGKQTHPVGRKDPNNFGLYDMHGNVWEWCEDWWNGSYKGAPDDGSPWRSGNSSYRVLRGGSWYNNARGCRAANRYSSSPESTNNPYGFRVVLAFL